MLQLADYFVDKYKKKFDDAVIFKMAMLIKIYSERTEKAYDKA